MEQYAMNFQARMMRLNQLKLLYANMFLIVKIMTIIYLFINRLIKNI